MRNLADLIIQKRFWFSPSSYWSPWEGERAGGPRTQDLPLRDGGTGAAAYAEAVGVYLAFALSKVANIGSSIASWMSDRGAFRETFATSSYSHGVGLR